VGFGPPPNFMPAPETYLLTVPDIKDDPLGRCITSTDIIRKLNKINPLIIEWKEYTPGIWYPGMRLGITCLWYKHIGRKGHKITGIRHGPVPEWTQLDDKGEVITLGWRRIFSKVIKRKAATTEQIEQAFGVTIALGGMDSLCSWCRKSAKTVKATSPSGYCDMHERVRLQVVRSGQLKDEAKYQRRIA